MTDQEEPQESQPEIILPQEEMPGVWANFASISHTAHEFTIDFTRMEADGSRGIVVSRVSVSPLFVSQFIEALNQNWARYAEKAMPHDLGPGSGGPDDAGGPGADNPPGNNPG